jgi:hypothetical protein
VGLEVGWDLGSWKLTRREGGREGAGGVSYGAGRAMSLKILFCF